MSSEHQNQNLACAGAVAEKFCSPRSRRVKGCCSPRSRAWKLRVRGLGSSAFAESKLGKLKARFSVYFSNFKPSYLSHFKSKLSDSKAKIQGVFVGNPLEGSESLWVASLKVKSAF